MSRVPNIGNNEPTNSPRAIPEQIRTLSEHMTTFGETVNMLLNRLTPACRQEPKSENQKDLPHPTTGCELADQVFMIDVQVRRINEAVEDALRRLEL